MRNYFDEDAAELYDELSSEMFDSDIVDATVDFLSEQCSDGRALEFGVGTGRIALPLAARGIDVAGIDLSRPMVDLLRDKPGGADIEVVMGDFATTPVAGTFSLVYLVFNTIMNVTNQSDQVACFQNAAGHLEPGGRFVVDVMVPGLRRLPPGQRHVVFHVDDTYLGVDEYDVAAQGLVSHHFTDEDGVVKRTSIPFRYVWPAELDLMAHIAGMRLRERYANWQRDRFDSESRQHVSVWEKPDS